MFVGRENEISRLIELSEKQTSSLVAITGRRRIGKSRLIQELAKKLPQYKYIEISGLAPREGIKAKDQRTEFTRQLQYQESLPPLSSEDWSEVFISLSKCASKGKVLILLDEISWMAQGDPDFLGKFKIAWDTQLRNNPKLILVICGSISSWIEKNILSSTGFMGRISLRLSLKEISLKKCLEFWGAQQANISFHEKLKVLSVTGGVPRYLEEILPKLPAEKNIQKLCFEPEGILFNEFNDIFSDLFGKKSDTYHLIISALSKGSRDLNDISQATNLSIGGTLTQYLEELECAGFIQRNYIWSLTSGKSASQSQFRISDNYLRFYIQYIQPNRTNIKNQGMANQALSQLPAYESIMGYQFENLVLNNTPLIWSALHIQPSEVLNHGPFFQSETKLKRACQVDYLIQSKYGTLYVIEIKFSKNVIPKKVHQEIIEKSKKIKCKKHQSIRLVLIHVNGVNNIFLEMDSPIQVIDYSKIIE